MEKDPYIRLNIYRDFARDFLQDVIECKRFADTLDILQVICRDYRAGYISKDEYGFAVTVIHARMDALYFTE